jgi:hypothetical protein
MMRYGVHAGLFPVVLRVEAPGDDEGNACVDHARSLAGQFAPASSSPMRRRNPHPRQYLARNPSSVALPAVVLTTSVGDHH